MLDDTRRPVLRPRYRPRKPPGSPGRTSRFTSRWRQLCRTQSVSEAKAGAARHVASAPHAGAERRRGGSGVDAGRTHHT